MIQPSGEDLFSVTISPMGSDYLKRSLGILKWTYALMWVVSVASLLLAGVRIDEANRLRENALAGFRSFVVLGIFPPYYVFSALINLVSVFLFFRFVRLCNKGIETGNQQLFNTAFRWLYYNCIAGAIICATGVVFMLLTLYFSANDVLHIFHLAK